MNKICTLCNIEKDKDCFDLGRTQCRSCRYNQRKNRLIKSGLYIPTIKTKKSDQEIKNIRKQYYLEHKEKILSKRKEYRKNNPNKVKSIQKKCRISNLEKYREYDRQYHQLHKEKRRTQTRKYEYKKWRENPEFRIRSRLRNSIYVAITENKSVKSGSILQYLPYTIEQLKNHLESQFESWMTWDNWGIYSSENWNDNDKSTWTWQIDHIIPHAKFKYSSMEDEEFKQCWALNNLRPYSAKQNVFDRHLRKT